MEYKLTFYDWRDGLKDGKLLGLKCNDCGTINCPPRKVCRECGGENQDIIELSKKGRIITLAVCNTLPAGFTGPYVVAMAELDEGCNIMGNVAGIDPAEAGQELIGKEVEVGYKEIPGDFLTGGDNRFPMILKITG